MHTLVTLAILVATTATAAADPRIAYRGDRWHTTSARDLPQNRQPMTEARYQPRNQLAEVRLDAFHDRAYVQLPRYAGTLDYLELRAGHTPFAIADVEVRFADGTSLHTGSRGFVEPHHGRVIDLPRGSAPVVAVIPHYAVGTRAPARLEVFGVPEYRAWHASW